MLTLNAGDHDLMKHMLRPDSKRLPDMHKRTVVILPEGLYGAWLDAPARSPRISCGSTQLIGYWRHKSSTAQVWA